MSKSLTDKTISGLNWSFISNNLIAVINIVIGIILARLLMPQDFGLLGMTYVFIGLAELFVTLGMGSAVQRVKNLSNDHIRVATTLTIISSVAIYLMLWFAAPLVAQFYNEQRIVSILRVISIIFIIQGFITVSYGIIRRELDFKYILKVDASSNILGYGLTSAVLAFLGFGVWSLVYGRIVSAVVSAFVIMRRVPVNLKPLIKKNEVKDLAGFGGGISLSNLLFYASSNVDLLIVGKFLNSGALGLYTRALNLMKETINKITGGIYNVLFPAFAAVQDDPQKLKIAYFRTIQTVSYFVYPILIAMIINAEFIIKGLFGSKWAGAITSFQLLGIAGVLRVTLQYSGALAHATGKVYTEAMQQLIYFLLLAGFALFAIKYGIEGVAVSIIIASLWLFIAQSWLSLKILKSKWPEFFKIMIPGFANMIVMSIANIFLYYVCSIFFRGFKFEFLLLFVVISNCVVLLSCIFFIPSSIKADTFEWLIEKYRRFIPSFILKLYLKFN